MSNVYPVMTLTQRRWKAASRLAMYADSAQLSQPYNSKLMTRAWYAMRLARGQTLLC